MRAIKNPSPEVSGEGLGVRANHHLLQKIFSKISRRPPQKCLDKSASGLKYSRAVCCGFWKFLKTFKTFTICRIVARIRMTARAG